MNRIKLSLTVLIFTYFGITSCKMKSTEKIENEVVASSFSKESKADFDHRMEWWRDARLGMFIHWGLYSVAAGMHNGQDISGLSSWIMWGGKILVSEYKEYAKAFNPIKFDSDEWVSIAKKASMKYIVITSKHHEGFGLYYSILDWYHPDAQADSYLIRKPRNLIIRRILPSIMRNI